MKLWLDDTRKPPDDSWYWCFDVEDAKDLLFNESVTEQSLDHDLGPGNSDALTLVVWEHDHGKVPLLTIVHSWNKAGADRIVAFLHQHHYHAIVEPDPRPPSEDQ
jgi:hypothetical protein